MSGNRIHKSGLALEVPWLKFETLIPSGNPSPWAHWVDVQIEEGGDGGREEGRDLAPTSLRIGVSPPWRSTAC
eukprot:3789403-Pyramimonas_sp.AAC.1